MSESSASSFDFPRPAPRVRRAEDETVRSSPIVFVGSVAWLTIVLSGVLQYINSTGINLYYYFVGIYIPFFAILCLRQVLRLGTNPQFWMWVATIVLPGVLFLMGQTGGIFALQSLKNRIVFFSLVAGSAVILRAPDARRILRTASVLALAWAIPICFIELLAGEVFSTAEGRSAGLHGNPNSASMAILICLLGAVDITRQTTRSLLLVTFATAAVFTTFSRSGILFAAALWAFHAFFPGRGQGGLRGPQRMIVIAFLVVAGVAATVQIAQKISLSGEAAMRVQSLLSANISDASSATRLSLVREGLDLVGERLGGYGVGYTEGLERLPHNTYVYVALDYGVAGAVFYVLLLLFGLLRSIQPGWRRGANSIALAILLTYASFFTHYVIGTTFYTVAFAVLITGALITSSGIDAGDRQRALAGHRSER